MEIDTFLPDFTVREYHEIIIDAPAADVYETLQSVDFSENAIIRRLFTLRGITIKKLSIEKMRRMTPVLKEEKNSEIIMGKTKRVLGGHLRLIWNFKVRGSNSLSLLSTETRVKATGAAVWLLFRIYWMFISIFSKWIRRLMLKMVKTQCEKKLAPPCST